MMMEPIQMDTSNTPNQNQMDDEKSTIQLIKKYWEQENVKTNVSERQIEIIQRQHSSSSEDEQIPEIKDIYDQIYGNVKNKRVFYEGQRNTTNSDQKPSTNGKNTLVIENSKEDKLNHDEAIKTKSVVTYDSSNISSGAKDNLEKPLIDENPQAHQLSTPNTSHVPIFDKIKNFQETKNDKALKKVDSSPSSLVFTKRVLEEVQKDTNSDEVSEVDEASTPTPINSPVFDKRDFERRHSNIEKKCENTCNKCQKADFINDRSEVLTEINANLKLELESVKQQLKNEMVKNNELNFEIANIEAVLETYYKEAKNQKSTLSTIYSAMKNYVADHKADLEGYTYKRIKMIADYLESLKNKLEHQDKIIKNNFIENPYYTDLMIKHEAVLRQLDDMSKVNQELQDEMKNKAAEELDIIKELNRQKFQIENKCKEMESYYRNEMITKEALIRSVEDEYKKQLEDFQTVLDQKDEEMAKIQKTATARINNYKQELVIVYRKWKDQKMSNNSNK